MPTSPTPLERLLRLEQDLEQLRSRLDLPRPRDDSAPPPPRRTWPGDELLLIRLVRRTPIALTAYQAAAELTCIGTDELRLTCANNRTSFQFCELDSGDAVVWIQPPAPDWIWSTPTVSRLFACPPDLEPDQERLPQSLPLFKPVVRGKQWKLVRPGDLVPRHQPSLEQTERATLLQRLEALERTIHQRTLQHQLEISELRHQLTVLQNQLQRLLSLSGAGG